MNAYFKIASVGAGIGLLLAAVYWVFVRMFASPNNADSGFPFAMAISFVLLATGAYSSGRLVSRFTSRSGACLKILLATPGLYIVIPLSAAQIWDDGTSALGTVLFASAFYVLLPGLLTATGFYLSPHGRYLHNLSLCQRCGYDLRGNVSGACPECGSSIRPGQPDTLNRI